MLVQSESEVCLSKLIWFSNVLTDVFFQRRLLVPHMVSISDPTLGFHSFTAGTLACLQLEESRNRGQSNPTQNQICAAVRTDKSNKCEREKESVSGRRRLFSLESFRGFPAVDTTPSLEMRASVWI